MKKFNVTVKILYDYTVKMPQNDEKEEENSEIFDFCDANDPVFKEICKILTEHNIGFDCYIKEITDENTMETIYKE